MSALNCLLAFLGWTVFGFIFALAVARVMRNKWPK